MLLNVLLFNNDVICALWQWIKDGFLEIVNASKKGRSYRLGKNYRALN